jgi:hypothetical protein
MSEWISRAALVTNAPASGPILDQLTTRFGRSPRAIQAAIDLLHRIPPRAAEPYVTSDHLRAAFENWQDAFLRGKHATLPEDVVRLKMRRWTRYFPDLIVQTVVDRKIENARHWNRGMAGAKGITEDSLPYEYYKVGFRPIVFFFKFRLAGLLLSRHPNQTFAHYPHASVTRSYVDGPSLLYLRLL